MESNSERIFKVRMNMNLFIYFLVFALAMMCKIPFITLLLFFVIAHHHITQEIDDYYIPPL